MTTETIARDITTLDRPYVLRMVADHSAMIDRHHMDRSRCKGCIRGQCEYLDNLWAGRARWQAIRDGRR